MTNSLNRKGKDLGESETRMLWSGSWRLDYSGTKYNLESIFQLRDSRLRNRRGHL